MSTETAASAIEDINLDLEGTVVPSIGGVIGDLGVVGTTMLTRLDLSLACFSEKVTNLSILVMHLATMESELEALISEKDRMGFDSLEKVLEFDMLSGVLDSEIRVLEEFLDTVKAGIADSREILVTSGTQLGEGFMEMQDKFPDSEQLLQSEEQFAEIKLQLDTFWRTLCSFKMAENDDGEAGEVVNGIDESLNAKAEIKMQTTEQQRNILMMLEKSLAREMDLEKSLNDSKEVQENLKLRMYSLEQELVHMEDDTNTVWERLFEADNAREILMGISKGLLGTLQVSQLNLNGLSHRESQLQTKLEAVFEQLKSRDFTLDKTENSTNSEAKLKDAEDKLNLANSEVFTLNEKVSSLEKKLKETEVKLQVAMASADDYQKQYIDLSSETRNMETLVVELKENVSSAESRANSAEAQCKLLDETNSKLTEEITLLKDKESATSISVDSLQRQLKESNLLLLNAIASAEASQEKQRMLYSSIGDMDNVIKDLKSKVSKAESRADSAEENCIILSESNAELNEEINFLRSRLECLEGSLHREEEAKMATAKDIGKQAKLFKNLIMQLAVERDRLMQQLSSLACENKVLAAKLKQMT